MSFSEKLSLDDIKLNSVLIEVALYPYNNRLIHSFIRPPAKIMDNISLGIRSDKQEEYRE